MKALYRDKPLDRWMWIGIVVVPIVQKSLSLVWKQRLLNARGAFVECIFRTADSTFLVVLLHVTVDDDEKELSVFEEVLSKLLNTENVCELSEDVIAEKLLDLQDIEITFKEDVMIISACKL